MWSTVLRTVSRRRRRAHLEPLEEGRVARVLRESAALEELQVCEVLGITTSRLRAYLAAAPPDPDASEDGQARPFPLPYAQVRAAAGRDRRRRWLVTTGVVVVTAMAALIASWLTRPQALEKPGDSLEAAPARVEDNPVGVVWWADDELHLTTSVVRVADVRRLVAAGTGAAYVDSADRLIGVTADGERTLLGQVAERSALVSSPRLGLVAWVDVSVPDTTRLVVWDVAEQQEVAAVVTRPRVRPITFDGGWLRFGQGLTDWAWDPSGGPAQLTGDGMSRNPAKRTALVDAVAGSRLEQLGPYLRVVRTGRRGDVLVSGFGGTLSADGRHVLSGTAGGRQPHLYDARSGDRLDTWGPQWDVRGATFSEGGLVTWLVEQEGEYLLMSCVARPWPTCSTYVRIGRASDALLAGDSRQ
jgi:hypothetical protein